MHDDRRQALGAPDGVRRATRAMLDVFNGSNRLILSARCAIPAETPAANLRAMIAPARA